MEKAAIVILNWNGVKFLQKFLPTLVSNTPKTFGESNKSVSIIVADNNSSDNSIEWLNSNYPQIRTIILDKNYGFTGGYNRALKEVDAEYFILLNSDILVPDNWLEPMLEFMETNPQVGICQPKMLSYQRHLQVLEEYSKQIALGKEWTNKQKLSGRQECFEYAGACGGFIDKNGFPFCRGRVLSNIEDDYGQYDSQREVMWASGACMLVRSSVWRELGGLDELFFAHMEEIDFCWRAHLHGYGVWVIPQSKVYHVGGGTLPNNSPRKLYFNYRNNLLMLYKNLPVNEGWNLFGYKKPKNRNLYIYKRMCIDGLTAIIYILQFKFSFFCAVVKAHSHYRKMKKDMTITVTDNSHISYCGIYPKSILVGKLIGRKINFKSIR